MKPEIVAASDRSFPLMLNIEPTLSCNLACFMCPAHNGTVPDMRKAGMMSWELYSKIIDECAAEGKLKVLNMHKDGESVLHPRFADMLAYAKKKNAAEIVHFNTNLTFKDDTLIDRIFDSGVDDISLSIDATCRETFLKVKGKDMFDMVYDNAMEMFEKRSKRNLSKPYMRAKFLGTEDNYEEAQEFKKIWQSIADEVQVQTIHNFAGGLELNRFGPGERYPCSFLFYSTAVNWDGTIAICHRDYKGEDVMGDLTQHTLKEVYSNEKYRRYLRLHIEDKPGEIRLCKNCDNWKDGPDYGVETNSRLANLKIAAHRNQSSCR